MPIDVLAKITHGYYQLTTAEKKVADYVLLHTWETQYMSISELAEACDVAEATVSRFCRRLRFSGYSGFKLALANTPQSSTPRLTGDIAPDDSVEELLEKLRTAHIDALDQTMRLLAPGALGQAVDLLTAADRVLCMGQGGSMILAMEASHLFANISAKFQCVQDSHRQANRIKNLNDGTALFFLPQHQTVYFVKDIRNTDILVKCHNGKSCSHKNDKRNKNSPYIFPLFLFLLFIRLFIINNKITFAQIFNF